MADPDDSRAAGNIPRDQRPMFPAWLMPHNYVNAGFAAISEAAVEAVKDALDQRRFIGAYAYPRNSRRSGTLAKRRWKMKRRGGQ